MWRWWWCVASAIPTPWIPPMPSGSTCRCHACRWLQGWSSCHWTEGSSQYWACHPNRYVCHNMCQVPPTLQQLLDAMCVIVSRAQPATCTTTSSTPQSSLAQSQHHNPELSCLHTYNWKVQLHLPRNFFPVPPNWGVSISSTWALAAMPMLPLWGDRWHSKGQKSPSSKQVKVCQKNLKKGRRKEKRDPRWSLNWCCAKVTFLYHDVCTVLVTMAMVVATCWLHYVFIYLGTVLKTVFSRCHIQANGPKDPDRFLILEVVYHWCCMLPISIL